MQHMVHIKKRSFRIYLHVLLCIIPTLSIRTPDSPSVIHLHHLQILLFLGSVTWSQSLIWFSDLVFITMLRFHVFLLVHAPNNSRKEPLELATGSSYPKSDNDINDYQETLCNLAEVTCFPIVEYSEKTASIDFVGDTTHQQPVTKSNVLCINASAGISLYTVYCYHCIGNGYHLLICCVNPCFTPIFK